MFGGAADQTAATEHNNIINISKGDNSSMALVKDHSVSNMGGVATSSLLGYGSDG